MQQQRLRCTFLCRCAFADQTLLCSAFFPPPLPPLPGGPQERVCRPALGDAQPVLVRCAVLCCPVLCCTALRCAVPCSRCRQPGLQLAGATRAGRPRLAARRRQRRPAPPTLIRHPYPAAPAKKGSKCLMSFAIWWSGTPCERVNFRSGTMHLPHRTTSARDAQPASPSSLPNPPLQHLHGASFYLPLDGAGPRARPQGLRHQPRNERHVAAQRHRGAERDGGGGGKRHGGAAAGGAAMMCACMSMKNKPTK